MIKININYEGELRCELTHQPSGSNFKTDAPVDNNGKGESFSPTDLCASALGSCIATIVGMQMNTLGVDMKGMRITVGKTMSSDLPRRIVQLSTEIFIPVKLSEAQKTKVEMAAKNCPVYHSLHPDIEKPVVIHWS